MIIDRYHGTAKNGVITFDDADLTQQAHDDFDALNEMDVDLDIVPVELHTKDLAGISLSINDIEALDGFVLLLQDE